MAYQPSVWRLNKYGKYLMYYAEFMKRIDLYSLITSLKYVLFKNLPKENKVVKTAMGTFCLRKNTTDFQFVNWTYEKEIKDYLKTIKNEIGLFVDIGACIGEYSIWLGNEGITCVAIEPVNFPAILTNLSFNPKAINKVSLYNYAVGAERKMVSFNVLEGVTSSSHISNEEIGEIECWPLDNLLYQEMVDPKKITFIKLDVEGMEIEALKGAVDFIVKTPNLQIVYEYCSVGDNNIRDLLNQYAKFEYCDLDGVNTLAIKKQP